MDIVNDKTSVLNGISCAEVSSRSMINFDLQKHFNSYGNATLKLDWVQIYKVDKDGNDCDEHVDYRLDKDTDSWYENKWLKDINDGKCYKKSDDEFSVSIHISDTSVVINRISDKFFNIDSVILDYVHETEADAYGVKELEFKSGSDLTVRVRPLDNVRNEVGLNLIQVKIQRDAEHIVTYSFSDVQRDMIPLIGFYKE